MTYAYLLNYALRILSIKSYSEADLLSKLRKKAGERSSEHDVQQVITRLKELELINDYEYARSLIRRKVRTSPCGIYHVRYYLKKYGISPELINQTIQEAALDELSLAQQVLEKKARKFVGLDHFAYKQKVSQTLSQRGFSAEIVAKILQKHSNIDTLQLRN